jgi:glycosyltransferase involved in cell wall biosynthesis
MGHPSAPEISLILPVRNLQWRLVTIIEQLLDGLGDLTVRPSEVIIVDDASDDATPEVAEELARRFPQVRWLRNSRPLGLEAAGQAGLAAARGELVFIQEAPQPVRIADLQRLYSLAHDQQLVAARAQSTPRPLPAPLLRRLRAWGSRLISADQPGPLVQAPAGLQMIRRRHAHALATGQAAARELELSRIMTTSYEPAQSLPF